MGLHSKGAKKSAKTTGKVKTKAPTPKAFELTSEPYQMGLGPF